MMHWLPGTNCCDISEEETTRAFHALYQMALPDNQNSLQNHAGGSVASDMHGLGGNNQNVGAGYMANGGKKKQKLRETPKASSNHDSIFTSNLNKQQELVKKRSLKNVNQPVAEWSLVSKSNALIPGKSSDVHGKYLSKSKECMTNGDDRPRKKPKRESDQYDPRVLKKLKIKSGQTFVETRGIFTEIQDFHERGNFKETESGLTEKLKSLEKKHGNRLQDSSDSGCIDVKTHTGREISVKKRKLRDRDQLMTLQSNGGHLGDSEANAFVMEVSGETGFRKQKKSKVFQTEKKESG